MKYLIDWQFLYAFFFSFWFFFSMQHMEIPGLDQIRAAAAATATAIAMQDPTLVCDLHHSSQHSQRQILNPLSEARDQTHILMDTSRVRYCWIAMGIPLMPSISTFSIKILKLWQFL